MSAKGEITGVGSIFVGGATVSGHGTTGDGVRVSAEDAVDRARRAALQKAVLISAMCRNAWPRSPRELVLVASEELLEQLLEFALHARRYMEIKQAKKLPMTEPYWEGSTLSPPSELSADGWTIVNRLLHHRHFELIAWDKRERDAPSERRVFPFAKVTSDQGAELCFCPDALAMAFVRLASQSDTLIAE